MSSKPENQFIRSVHAHLGLGVYFEKMCNPYRNGTPDVWYSGNGGDLWVEYKFIPRIPKNQAVLPELTERQTRWLNARFNEGRNVAVIVGHRDGGIIFRDRSWEVPGHIHRNLSRADLAKWIRSEVLHVVPKEHS